jgi:hypothetical protein
MLSKYETVSYLLGRGEEIADAIHLRNGAPNVKLSRISFLSPQITSI